MEMRDRRWENIVDVEGVHKKYNEFDRERKMTDLWRISTTLVKWAVHSGHKDMHLPLAFHLKL